MRWKLTEIILAFVASVCLSYAATTVSFSLGLSTGDSDFDLTLRNINIEAQQSLPSYYASMRYHYGTSSEVIDGLLYRHMLSPADAFMVIRLSFLIGQPIDFVVVRYAKHRGKGWGAVAKSLGIRPGSPAFHQLKQGGVLVLDRSKKERTQIEVNINVEAGKGGHGGHEGKKAGRGGGGGGGGKGKGKK